MSEKFKKGEVNIIVATKAFGMGIDIPNVRAVVCWSLVLSRLGIKIRKSRKMGNLHFVQQFSLKWIKMVHKILFQEVTKNY